MRCVLTGLLLAVAPAVAGAQDSGDLIRAQAHSNAASALFKEGDYAAALEELGKANELVPAPIYLFNTARCHEEMGSFADAVEQYERFLAVAEDKRRANRARKAVARLAEEAFGSVEVTCEPAGANVILEGFDKGERCPHRWARVRPGSYALAVLAQEHARHDGRLEVEAGAATQVAVELAPLPDEPGMRAAVGTLAVTSDPAGADVRLDGQPVGATPTGEVEVAAGSHVPEVDAPWHATWSRQAEVGAGEVLSAHADLASQHLAWALAGGAVAAVVGAGCAYALAADAEQDQAIAEDAYGRATSQADIKRHGDAMAAAHDRVGNSLVGAGTLAAVAAGLAAGSAYLFLRPDGPDEDRVSVRPAAAGLSLTRSW